MEYKLSGKISLDDYIQFNKNHRRHGIPSIVRLVFYPLLIDLSHKCWHIQKLSLHSKFLAQKLARCLHTGFLSMIVPPVDYVEIAFQRSVVIFVGGFTCYI